MTGVRWGKMIAIGVGVWIGIYLAEWFTNGLRGGGDF